MSTTDVPPISSAVPAEELRGADEVLGSARHAQRAADAAQVQILVDAVDWAVMNPPLFGREASRWTYPSGGGGPVREDLTAEGVPDVCRSAVAELGLAMGVSTHAAQRLIADGLELAYRLPQLWIRLVAGEVESWRARKVAQATRPLSRLAARFVDKELAPVADRISGRQLEGLISTAMARHDRDLADRLAAERVEQRGVEIGLDETTLNGLTPITGCLDLPDALDLEAAISQEATQLAMWGSEESLDVRRARALGELAREHLTLTGTRDAAEVEGADGPTADKSGRRSAPNKRALVLYAHLTDTAIMDMLRRRADVAEAGCGSGAAAPPGPVHMGRIENTDTPITAETIREWVNDPSTKAIIRPVLDLAGYQHAGSYEVPARIKEQVRLRDGTCQFPGCHAKGLYCQNDHTTPYDHDDPEAGGQTETTGLVLLCQLHHNLKTHHGFSYTVLSNGAVLWRTPSGLRIRRNRDGTVDYLTRHHRRYCDDPECTTCPSGTGVDAGKAKAARPRTPGTPLPGFEAADLDDLGPPPF